MKKLIIAWTIFALIFEFGVLFALDKFILVDSYDFKITEVKEEQKEVADINTVLKEGVENISLSYNGKYIAYKDEKSLCVEDTKTGVINEVPRPSNERIMYYKWLENRNIIAVIEMNENGEIHLVTYNPADSSKAFVQEICDYTKNIKVENMATSVLTNVYYVDIKRENSKDSVYRIDRNNDISKVNIKAKDLGNIKTIPHEDRLIYEDKSNGKFFITSPDQELKFNVDDPMSLLGIDKNDVIYMGQLKGDKVVSILYGKISENTYDWKTKTLEEPAQVSDIYFNDNSEIIINNNSKSSVKNIMTGKEIEYSGTFIQVNNDFVASIDSDRKLKCIKLNK